jgi:AraC-like DNA-binding protein
MEGHRLKFYKIEHARRTGDQFKMPVNHYHDFYEIYYLVSGSRTYFIKDRTYTIHKGDLVFIDNYELHRTGDTDNPEHERILIYFDKEWLASLGPAYTDLLKSPFHRKEHTLSLKLSDQTAMEQLLFTMVTEQEQKPLGWELHLQALLMQFMILCGRLAAEEPGHAPENYHPLHRKMTEITGFINQNYKSNLTLTIISETFSISPSYFCRNFKEFSGFTFIEYLNTIRVREAQRLLRETKTKVIDISEQSGFESIAHFGRVYKQLTKQSPLQYRKIARQQRSAIL